MHPVAIIERAWKCDSCRGCHFVVCVFGGVAAHLMTSPAIRSPRYAIARLRAITEGWCERPQPGGGSRRLAHSIVTLPVQQRCIAYVQAPRVSCRGNDVIRGLIPIRGPLARCKVRCCWRVRAAVAYIACAHPAATNGSTFSSESPDRLLRCCPGYDDISLSCVTLIPGCRGSHANRLWFTASSSIVDLGAGRRVERLD